MSEYGVFMTHGGLIQMDAIFARALRDQLGWESVAIVHGTRDRVTAEEEQAFGSVVDVLQGFDPDGCEKRLRANLGLLAELEQTAGESTIYQDIYQDRWLLGRFDLAIQASYLARGAQILWKVLEGDVRVVMGEMTMALYRMARRMVLGRRRISTRSTRVSTDACLDSRELIRQSRCVFTISGTAALEALFFGVPAIVFSHVFFAPFQGITGVFDLYALPDHVRSLLKGGRPDTRRSSLAALAAMYTESYPGLVMSEVADARTVRAPENKQAVGAALAMELTLRQHAVHTSARHEKTIQ